MGWGEGMQALDRRVEGGGGMVTPRLDRRIAAPFISWELGQAVQGLRCHGGLVLGYFPAIPPGWRGFPARAFKTGQRQTPPDP